MFGSNKTILLILIIWVGTGELAIVIRVVRQIKDLETDLIIYNNNVCYYLVAVLEL